MSTRPEAKLFYGYLQPEADKEEYNALEDDEDTPWSAIHGKKAYGCIGEIYGYSESLGFFLAVEESLHTAEWDEVKSANLVGLAARYLESAWDVQLRQAAETFGLDVTGIRPGWYQVCLYL